ncbi:C40 family peptidase [Beijerinckia sp. L45]|uniref:C40 family peptidase n=1 Tax=Beijerinckia sp. L45 TaxID=1641855 RepID=UPI00131A6DB0|nr:NlpC/P60 family protein [Beijerinckia sp. L45]
MSGRDGFDPRLTPARFDLAAAHLEGRVAAERFVRGERRTITADVADIRRLPRPDAPLDTQALHGEPVTLYDEDEGWGWIQLEGDGYVGYVAMHALGFEAPQPTHVVGVNRTFVYPAADMKQPIVAALPLGAGVAIDRTQGEFSHCVEGGFVFTPHIAPVATPADDFVAVAERFTHTPYLWGGKSALGIDCSGLVQVSLARSGIGVPRDTDLQERAAGAAVPFDAGLSGLQRGDLVFWRGHVGIMCDAAMLLHANAHHMSVAMEPLQQAAARIHAKSQASITSVRRFGKYMK